MRKRLSVFLGTLVATVAMQPVAGAVLLTDGTGKLTGATGVTVGGSTYNVEFVEGTCISLFGGCDSVGDFAFQTQADAQAAAAALLSQVFIGSFDTDFTLTFGCTSAASACFAIVPYALSGANFTGAIAFNNNTVADGGTSTVTADRTSFDTAQLPGNVFARFSSAPVPEPASWLMMLLGFGGIGMSLRKRLNRPVPQHT